MIKNQLFIAAALLVGAAIGYLLKPDKPVVEPEKKVPVTVAKISSRGESASVKALRARVAELEKLLAAREAEKPVEQVAEAKPQSEAQGERRGPPSMKEMREEMENLKKDNPEEFAKREKRMAKFRQWHLDRTNRNLNFLSSVDTSGMTEAQLKAHEKYQDLIVRREELEEKMHNSEMTDEDREDIERDRRETDHALWQAARAERETLIGETAKALGFTGDDAAAVSATIKDVISSTEQHLPPPPNGGPGGPR